MRDVGLADAEDAHIFARARDVGGVVITKDRDFVELLARNGPPPQVVWVTCGNTSNMFLRGVLYSAWPRIASMLRAGEPLIEVGGVTR